MLKVLYFSLLLLLGLSGSQVLPNIMGASYAMLGDIVRMLTMMGLSFIMIRVGYEFDIDKSNTKQYAWDYLVAFTAASFPWIFVTLYFTFILLPPDGLAVVRVDDLDTSGRILDDILSVHIPSGPWRQAS